MESLSQIVAVADCAPWPGNRKAVIDDEFVASIASKGIIEPLILRPYPEPKKGGPLYQIVCGERRWLAAKKLEMISVKAEIRNISDFEVVEINFLENFQRQDPTDLEFAEAITRMAEAHGESEFFKLDIAAANLGINRAKLARIRNLLNLSKVWKKEMKDREAGAGRFSLWTAEHFQRISVLPEKVQNELHENMKFYAGGIAIKDLDLNIAKVCTELKFATWELSDETLVPKAGSCAACPKQTQSNSDLFEFKDPQTGRKLGNRCLDKACWESKVKATIERTKEEMKAKHEKVLEVSPYSSPMSKGAVSLDGFQVTKESDPKAIPAIVVEGDSRGEAIYLKKKRGAKVEESMKMESTPKEKLAKLMKRRTVHVLRQLVEHVKSDLEWPKSDREMLISLAFVFGIDIAHEMNSDSKKDWKLFHSYVAKKIDVYGIWRMVAPRLINQLFQNINSPDPSMFEAGEIAKLVSADLKAMAAIAEKEIPMSAALAAELGI